jgi:iron complex outermembrane receptor protein
MLRRTLAPSHRRTAVIAFAALFCSAPLAAQSSFSEEVVVTAAATPVQLGTVTRTLTVITREQIAQLPAHSIADVLRLVGAVDVRARGERGAQTDFAIRGANFGQMLVLVDGIRLNDAQSGHHNGDIPVPLDAIERIEVLHGPGPRSSAPTRSAGRSTSSRAAMRRAHRRLSKAAALVWRRREDRRRRHAALCGRW